MPKLPRLLKIPSLAAMAIAAILLCSPAIQAQTDAPSATTSPLVEQLLVVGEQPGPGMWKVSKGNNTLWVIATHTPVPQNMKWRAKGIKEVVAGAQEVLRTPSISVSTKNLGILRTLSLLPMLPMAMEGRKNPDGARLKDLVPAETYARWLVLRDKYIFENNTDDESQDIERWRPIFAALELYRQAIQKNGMATSSPVWKTVEDEAKRSKVKVTSVTFETPLGNAGSAIRDLNKSRLEDLDCFTKTIDRIEAELGVMRKRANAWARGDIDVLRGLPWRDQREACANAIQNATFAQKLGMTNVASKIETAWIEQAEKSLATNAVTVAVLSLSDVVSKTSYLAKLRAKGYIVVEPAEQ
ncbi:MAG: TraB/GumN family protein [Aeromicrobium sp.]|nr:TraB/GumN family protein [Burkholderiales bacterium]